MNDLAVFQNPEFGELRTAEHNGETWFCLADICRPLGIVSQDVRERLKKDRVVTIHHTDKLGRPKDMLFVDESNLYRALFQSRKPEAERFTDWVTEEVLPSIRKTGRYENRPMTVAENLAAQAQLLVEQEKRIARIEQRVETALTAIARPSGDTWVEDMKAAIAGVLPRDGADGTGGAGAALRDARPGGQLQYGRPAPAAAPAAEGDGGAPAGLHGAHEAGRHRSGQGTAGGV